MDFVQKKNLKNGYFCVHESELPDFGRTWTPNRWHQVNFWGGPGTHGILTHSGFRKCSRFGWPGLRFEVTAAHSEVIGQKRVLLRKIIEPLRIKVLRQFSSERSEIESTWTPGLWVQVDSISDLLDQNWRSDFFCNNSFTTRGRR